LVGESRRKKREQTSSPCYGGILWLPVIFVIKDMENIDVFCLDYL